MAHVAHLTAPAAVNCPADEDWLTDPATQVELDLHAVDGSISHIRQMVNERPWLLGAFQSVFAEIAAEFSDLAGLNSQGAMQ